MSGKVVRVEVIAYFNHHPHRRCTCDEIARLLRKEREEVEPQLENLVRLGILERHEEGRMVLYGPRNTRAAEGGGQRKEDDGVPSGRGDAPPRTTRSSGESRTEELARGTRGTRGAEAREDGKRPDYRCVMREGLEGSCG
jgi:hypothetical protein